MDQVTDKVFVVGNHMILDLGYADREEVMRLKSMSADARKNFINELVAKYPEACKLTAGYCKKKAKHVGERECIACARDQGQIKLAEWEICRGQNLSR